MKNIIKIIIVLAITTSFFSVYSMEQQSLQCFYISDLKKVADVERLPIYLHDFTSFPIASNSSLADAFKASTPLFAPDLSDNLTLGLNAIKVIEDPNKEKQVKILQKIYDDLSRGLSTDCDYIIFQSTIDKLGYIEHSQKLVSLYTMIQNWLECPETISDYDFISLPLPLPENFKSTTQEKKEAYNSLISTIQQGQSSYTLKISNILITCILNKFEIKIPEVLATFLLSFVYNV